MQKHRRKRQSESEGQHVLHKTMDLVGNTAGAIIGTSVLLGAAGALRI